MSVCVTSECMWWPVPVLPPAFIHIWAARRCIIALSVCVWFLGSVCSRMDQSRVSWSALMALDNAWRTLHFFINFFQQILTASAAHCLVCACLVCVFTDACFISECIHERIVSIVCRPGEASEDSHLWSLACERATHCLWCAHQHCPASALSHGSLRAWCSLSDLIRASLSLYLSRERRLW